MMHFKREIHLKRLPSVTQIKDNELCDICPNKMVELEEEEIKPVEDVLDYYDFSVPDCFYWGKEEVLDWLKNEVELPQYSETFVINHINGKRLLLLNARSLPKMNIHDFSHIKKICYCIKKLYNFDYEGFDEGDISLLAPQVVRYEYLLYKAKSGLNYEQTTPREFLNKIFLAIREPPPMPCIWETMDPAKKSDLKIIKARTGIKRLPGQKKDPSLFVGMEDLVSRVFLANKSLKYMARNSVRQDDINNKLEVKADVREPSKKPKEKPIKKPLKQ